MSVSSFQSLIQRFFTDRLLKQQGQANIPLRLTETAFGYSSSSALNASGGRRPNCSSKILMFPSWGSFSNTSNSTAATAHGRETTAWLQSMPSSNT
jgi:hypothetical protein